MSLATASPNGVPEVATVEYLLDGDDLLVNTFVYYRKYRNLIENQKVACVITTEHDRTLQLDAVAKELSDPEAARAKQKLLAFDPSFKDFFSDESTRFFVITPTWMRLRDYTQNPLKITEYSPN